MGTDGKRRKVPARPAARRASRRTLATPRRRAPRADPTAELTLLRAQLREALERQAATSDVLKAISESTFDLQPMFDRMLAEAARLCYAEFGVLYRGRVPGLPIWVGNAAAYHNVPASAIESVQRVIADVVVHVHERGAELTSREAEDRARASDVPRPLAMQVYLARATVHVPDVLEDPELAGSSTYQELGVRAVLGVPMRHKDGFSGVITLWKKAPGPFDPSAVRLIETFADQAAIAIENVRLFNATKEALEQQTAVSEVLKTISRSAFDLQPVLDTVIENAARLCDADLAWMTEVEGSSLITPPVARYPISDGTPFGDGTPVPSAAERQLRPAEPNSIMGRPAVERRTIASEDVTVDPLLTKSTGALRVGARSVLGVPMLREGRPIGVFVLARLAVRPFSERETQLAETFADQAAIAIENVRLFNEIHEQSRQLEVASRHKSEFLTNMSHELRTPLNAIIGFTDVMLQEMFGPLNDKQKEYLQDVRGSGTHLLSLINDLLDLSKIEAGRVELDVSEFSLAAAIDNALTLVRERAARHDISLAADVSPDVGEIMADERKVKQVIVNLLSNAVKFTPDGGSVGIAARCLDDHVEVAVRDTGIGIAPEDRGRVFEEFQQVGRDPDRSREGTGLGLTLSKRFVELHGGRIWLESDPGKGSTFTFSLPLPKRVAVT